LVPFTPSLAVVVVAAGGLSVATIETYKTYLYGGPPGKFAGKPVRFEVSAARQRCRRVHGTVYGVLVAAMASEMLTSAGNQGSEPLHRSTALFIALLWASSFSALVLAPTKSATVEPSRGSDPLTQSLGSLTDVDIRGAGS
jgi:hypothetical protein